ncbi:MAG: 3D-(3,5/4)-trihydroxycyclohexane-1,2-dione acylhydrolase (decyclizing) [Firmicutes bacterium]|nr:3D-(3,5/4)-trihydroxycyclohexane-1,2-dione acylhydrolase (decyclizing) [Bacillota bacterium]
MSKRVRLTTAQALLRYLDAQYVTRDEREHKFVAGVLGIFGHGNVLGLGEALESGQSTLPFLQGHSEQGMVHLAAAYAKQRRRLGIYACTTSIGPGATNLVTGAAGATINRLPVLLLPGDVFADRQPDPVLQQLEYPYDRTVSVNDALKPVSVFWDRIMRPEQLLAALPEAMATLVDPAHTGAVTIALPQDVQAEAYDFPEDFFEPHAWAVPRPPVEPRELATVVRLVSQKKRPIIIAGGGVHYAEAEAALAHFAETLGVPVVETQAGKGALTGDHPWNFGGVGVTGSRVGNELVREADCILAVGTRLADFATASKSLWDPGRVLVVGLNVNRRDALKAGAVALVADARAGLQALQEALEAVEYRTAYDARELQKRKQAWMEEVAQWYRQEETVPLRQTAVLGALQELTEPHAVIVAAAGSLPGDLHRLWQVRDPLAYHVEYGYSCMGYEIAGALGVKMAERERPVYALVGDGSVLMLNAELVTMLQERQKVIVVVFDNQGYGSINSLQKAHGSGGFGTEFRVRSELSGQLTGSTMVIDFAKWGEAMGAVGFRATTLTEFREAVQRAQQEPRASVIDVKVGMGTGTTDSGAWWRVDVAEVSSSPAVQRAREDWARHRAATSAS